MKRIFTDADIYEDEWYQDLTIENKLLWDYICRRAKYGVWKPNHKLCKFQLNIDYNVEESFKAFNKTKERVVKTKNGRWFITGWINFQYPTLSDKCPAHKPVFQFFNDEYKYLFDKYVMGIYYPQEIEIVIDKEKKGGVGGNSESFEIFWGKYPNKKSKQRALKAWNSIKANEQLQNRILESLELAKTSVEWTKDGGAYVPHPASWLNAHGWEDQYRQKKKTADDVLRESGLI